MSSYQPQYKNQDGEIVDLPLNADKVDGHDAEDFAIRKNCEHLVYYVDGSSSTTAGTWLGTCDDITKYFDGLSVKYKITVAGASTTTLNINGLGAKRVYLREGAALTTHYSVGTMLILTYNESKGYWYQGDYDSTNTYQLRKAYGGYTAATVIYRYQILLTTKNGTLLPINTTNNSTATTKTLTTESFDIFGAIYYYNSSNTVSSGGTVGASALYKYILADLRYAFNTGTTLTANKSVYMVCVRQADGLFKLSSTPIVQALPTSADGLYYVYMGQAYSTYYVELDINHPIYYYENGSIRTYTGVKSFGAVGIVNGNSGNLARANEETDKITFNAGDGIQLSYENNPVSGHQVTFNSYPVGYAVCSTAAATTAKTVSIANFALVSGVKIAVKFTVTNTASSPTLNVNGTGAKSIYYRGAAISAGYLAANRTYEFVYNGTQYELVGDINTDTNTHYTAYLRAGASGTTTSAATTNGNTYLKLVENGTLRNGLNIKGTGATSVTSDSSGNIFIDSSALDTVYPVGAIYMSTSSTSPASLFGGTWSRIYGRFLFGAGSNTANTTTIYGSLSASMINRTTIGEQGGEVMHTLTTSEMPSHQHSGKIIGDASSSNAGIAMNTTWSKYQTITDFTNTVGGGGSHNNMPPYYVVYMWRRTA